MDVEFIDAQELHPIYIDDYDMIIKPEPKLILESRITPQDFNPIIKEHSPAKACII